MEVVKQNTNIDENIMNSIRVPETDLPRIVVIGGGFAGLALVKGLKNKDVQVIVLDRNNFHQFQPLLYQVATSGIVPDNIAFPLRKQFEKYKNVFFRMGEVLKIDTEKNRVISDIGVINFDYLVLATGSTTNFFGMEDVQTNGIGMKSIQEALDIRSMMLQSLEEAVVTSDNERRNALTSFVVVGGGPAGVETAGAIAEFRRYILPKDYPDMNASVMSIHLLEAGGTLLTGMSESSSKKALLYLEELGVKVHLENRVTSYDGNIVRTNTGLELPAKSLIWNAGVQGCSPDGLDKENFVSGKRILVDEFLEVKNYKGIYAIGDTAALISDEYPRAHPMVAQVAIQQGRTLAKNILNQLNGKERIVFEYKDKGSLATVGKRKAVADVWGMNIGGIIAWLIWSFVHLISISGFKNRLLVGIHWLWSYFSYDKGSRLIVRKYKRDN
ncbi:MAG: NAD(P)/FAD-dependent oxidoreductase [Brumimicrobium sp.]